jgi:hypothetical protein
VPRPRRKPRPPGSIRVVCTGRGKHDPVRFPPPLQLYDEGDRVRIKRDSRKGPAPVTPFHAADGLDTYDFKCGTCGRHWKRHEDEFITIAFALADHQGIRGDDNTPITVDISRIENA